MIYSTATNSFDLAGNRISQVHETISQSGSASPVAGTTTTDLAYDARNELTSQTVTATGSAPVITTDGYDPNGNELTSGTDSYTWDAKGNMASATVGTVTSTMGYDSSGERVTETTGNSTTTYLNDDNNPSGNTQILEERTTTTGTTPTTSLRSFVIGLTAEMQSDAMSGTVDLLRDGHGSVRTLLTTSGQQLERYDYLSGGNAATFEHVNPSTGTVTTITMSQAATDQLFGGGGFADSATGLYYAGTRWRQAADGNWISQDSMSFVPGSLGDANLYSFVGGHSINASDPSGHFTLTELGIVVGIVALVVAISIPVTIVARRSVSRNELAQQLATAVASMRSGDPRPDLPINYGTMGITALGPTTSSFDVGDVAGTVVSRPTSYRGDWVPGAPGNNAIQPAPAWDWPIGDRHLPPLPVMAFRLTGKDNSNMLLINFHLLELANSGAKLDKKNAFAADTGDYAIFVRGGSGYGGTAPKTAQEWYCAYAGGKVPKNISVNRTYTIPIDVVEAWNWVGSGYQPAFGLTLNPKSIR